MRLAMLLFGALCIVFGVALLVNQGMTYTAHRRVAEAGSVEITEKQPHRIPPTVGIIAVVGGLALVLLERKH